MSKAQPKTDPPDDLTREQRIRIRDWIARQVNHPRRGRDPFFTRLSKSKTLVRFYVDECLKWHRDTNVKRSDWARTCENWINGAKKRELERAADKAEEQPQMMGKRSALGGPLSDELSSREMFEGE